MPSILDPETERGEIIVPIRLGDPQSPLDQGPVARMKVSYPVDRWPWNDPGFVKNAAEHGMVHAVSRLK